MVLPRKTPTEEIRDVDGRLLVAGERLAQYRRTGPSTSVIVQQGVVDRLLDVRLVLMDVRDAAVTR